MYRLVVTEHAATELVESKKFYNKRVQGLGKEFEKEVISSLDSILAKPFTHPEVETEIRKAVLKRFPFVILYTVENTVIVILHVFHTSRNPNIWKAK
ncbi:MAG: type II toxin-antitoxin system RelE/ParE family toxin [Bacteroidota bacterium]